MAKRKLRILYADNQPENCDFLSRELSEYDVTCATTAAETLRLAAAGGFDSSCSMTGSRGRAG